MCTRGSRMHEIIGVEDIFDALILLEVAGRDAYAKLAESAKDEKVCSLFLILSKSEEAHRKLYLKMKQDVIPAEAQAFVSEEYLEYVSVLLEHNFTIVSRASESFDWQGGINLGIELEKQTILFLSDLHRMLEGSSRDPLLKVIKEEQNHLKALLQLQSKSKEDEIH